MSGQSGCRDAIHDADAVVHIVYCSSYSRILREDRPRVLRSTGDQVTTNAHAPAAPGEPTVSLRDPYPFFARKRSVAGVFRGTVMDYSKTPESMLPKSEYSAMSFNAVNTVFRDSRVFSSRPYTCTDTHSMKVRQPLRQ